MNNLFNMETRDEKIMRVQQLMFKEKIVEKEKWNNLPKFNNPNDVPKLPIVPKNEWEEFYVPRLIKAGGIPKKDLIDGKYYIGDHRRCNKARWNEKINKFIYIRDKFGNIFEETCNHFEDDDGFALFVPIKIINE